MKFFGIVILSRKKRSEFVRIQQRWTEKLSVSTAVLECSHEHPVNEIHATRFSREVERLTPIAFDFQSADVVLFHRRLAFS